VHRRTQIRDAAEALLAGVGAKVQKSRVHNWQQDDLPGVSLYTLSEPAEPVEFQRTSERTLALVIDIHAVSAGDVDADLDDLCVEVEKAIEADWQFGGLALRSNLTLTTIGLSGEAEARHGLARLEYAVVYRVDPANPDA